MSGDGCCRKQDGASSNYPKTPHCKERNEIKICENFIGAYITLEGVGSPAVVILYMNGPFLPTSRTVILAGGEGRKSEVIRTVVIVWIKKSLAAWSSVREGCVTCGDCKLYVIAVSSG